MRCLDALARDITLGTTGAMRHGVSQRSVYDDRARCAVRDQSKDRIQVGRPLRRRRRHGVDGSVAATAPESLGDGRGCGHRGDSAAEATPALGCEEVAGRTETTPADHGLAESIGGLWSADARRIDYAAQPPR